MTHLPPEPDTRTIAIIGGGYSGAVVAYTLARSNAADPDLRIVVIEPRALLGAGLAYSTADLVHRLNVPHTMMTIRTDDMGHFTRWLSGPTAPVLPPEAVTPDGRIFAPRAVFGKYLAETLAPFVADGSIRHLQTTAQDVRPDGDRLRVILADGTALLADRVVLALSHPAPVLPAQLQPLAGSDALVPDAFAPGAFEAVKPGDRLLVVGSGLTSADILATLDRRDHRGPVLVISRHGLRSKSHAPQQAESRADFTAAPETTALGLLRRARRAVAVDATAGLTWHAAFDRLRAQAPVIWAALPQDQRRRFLHHLRALWDVHRFRIAPQTFDTQDAFDRSGRATFLTGKLQHVVRRDDGLCVAWRARGSARMTDLIVDRIILATGPDHARVTETNPLLRRLSAAGLVAADPLRLGLHTSGRGTAIGRNGPDDRILIAGPLAREAVGELMGLPEVTGWAEFVARRVLETLRHPAAT